MSGGGPVNTPLSAAGQPRRPTIGVLPCYLELYDEILDEDATRSAKAFTDVIQAEYEGRNVGVVAAPACRNSREFGEAVAAFEAAEVDAIVTLHLAYSPSLESIDAICSTDLPVLVLDTTPDFSFGFAQTEDRILFNHGIHGVQDFCNLLSRRDRQFSIDAGHWKESDVIDRTVSTIRGISAAKGFRNQRVGIVGRPFHGMGDFAVTFDQLEERFGITVVEATSDSIAKLMPAADSDDVREEIESDLDRFEVAGLPRASHPESVAAGLGLRQWIVEESLAAMTFNFRDITGRPGLPVVPFLEASKAMARGIGYAGEGDVLTAALCAAVARVNRETTFTEMFCPDWEGGLIFMSHMGEVNIDITASKPVLELRPYPFSEADQPVIAAGCLRPGAAMLLNVAPGHGNTFALIAVPVEVCDNSGDESIRTGIRGWIKPSMEIADFLEHYSRAGGTHHCIVSYDIDLRFAQGFASALGWAFTVIGSEGD